MGLRKDHSSDSQKFLRSITRELFQTETSAVQHCRREAFRLGSTPPAQALQDVAAHAEEVLRELPALARRTALPISGTGSFTGAFLSELRDKLVDRVIHSERSYRSTLLGVRHGIDVVITLRALADVSGNLELFDFCESWLTRRTILVEHLEEEIAWFARHPVEAMRLARPLALRPRGAAAEARRSAREQDKVA